MQKRYRVDKNTPYFQGNVILPILEVTQVLKRRIVSLVVVDTWTRRLAGLTKDMFEKLLLTAGILG